VKQRQQSIHQENVAIICPPYQTHDHSEHEPKRQLLGHAWVENFFGPLKREFVYHRHYATRAEATQDIFDVYRGAL
jgi:hypothetical protein